MPVVVITAWSHAEIEAQVAGADRFVAEAVRPRRAERRRRGAARVTLARRMFLASVVLALVVGARLRGADRRRVGTARRDRSARRAPQDVTARSRCGSRSSSSTWRRASAASCITRQRSLLRAVHDSPRERSGRISRSPNARRGRPRAADARDGCSRNGSSEYIEFVETR